MMFGDDRIGTTAAQYRETYGMRAIARIDDDINRAIGRASWDECSLLQRTRLRLRRFELQDQIAERMALCQPSRCLLPSRRNALA